MPGKWELGTVAKIERLVKEHAAERAALEFDIECHPLEPQFSAKVQELIEMEEAAGKKGHLDRQEAISTKLDTQMRHECRSALKYIVDMHSRQRMKLYNKHVARREELVREITAQIAEGVKGRTRLPAVDRSKLHSAASTRGDRGDGDAMAAPAPAPQPEMSPRELDMRKRTARTWAAGEKFNLMKAFQRQIDRIYSDWGEYLDAMEKEFVVESCRLEGVDPTSALAAIDARKAAALMSPTSQQQFLDREKQEQLVHTAPVLSPSAPASGHRSASPGSAGVSSFRSSSVAPAVRRQLVDLRRRYEAAKLDVVVQRDSAVRWVLRQRNRMFMQVDALELERQMQDAHERREEGIIAELIARVKEHGAALLQVDGGAAADTDAVPAVPTPESTKASSMAWLPPVAAPLDTSGGAAGFGEEGGGASGRNSRTPSSALSNSLRPTPRHSQSMSVLSTGRQ